MSVSRTFTAQRPIASRTSPTRKNCALSGSLLRCVAGICERVDASVGVVRGFTAPVIRRCCIDGYSHLIGAAPAEQEHPGVNAHAPIRHRGRITSFFKRRFDLASEAVRMTRQVVLHRRLRSSGKLEVDHAEVRPPVQAQWTRAAELAEVARPSLYRMLERGRRTSKREG